MAGNTEWKDRMLAAASASARVRVLAEWMGEAFQLPLDDVSLLVEQNGVLVFQHPEALRKCTVPITRKSVAGMTFDSNKIYVYNNLTDVEHVQLFEKLVKTEDVARPVQRIISCPIPGRNGPRGVLQVCRKGEQRDRTAAFTREDVTRMSDIARAAGRHLFVQETGGEMV